MKKIKKLTIFYIFFIIYMTGCTSLHEKKIDDAEKQSLNKLILNLKNDLKNNEIERLENSIDLSYRNKKIIEELKKIDFSKINIFTSKPKYIGNYANNIVGLVYKENSLYLEIEYLYNNGKWKIKKIIEK